ncbi:MAG: glycosyltransferase family 2 protein [Candidatus Omnitrophica bacterium]|nr:glycosyltransferase family 2 protein [Candidatus Omnitrophota bacterium]
MKKETLNTPVVFTIFNRPDFTKKVFKAIAKAKPKKLFVIADGPRPNMLEDAKKCTQARAVIDKIDWNSEVIKKYSDVNLGNKKGVSSGLNWVFSQVEEAIILDDDCLPAPSFFFFCQELLEKYRNNQRVMHISGDNFFPKLSESKDSYFFSKTPYIWGFATWKRAWLYYDVDMKSWSDYKNSNKIKRMFVNPCEWKYWRWVFDKMLEAKVDTWDYAWHYACLRQEGLSIIPRVNLVSNMGFSSQDATQYKEKLNFPNNFVDRLLAGLPVSDIWEIRHPSRVLMNRKYDAYIFNHILYRKHSRRNALKVKRYEYLKRNV